jgi:hypothetical protein
MEQLMKVFELNSETRCETHELMGCNCLDSVLEKEKMMKEEDDIEAWFGEEMDKMEIEELKVNIGGINENALNVINKMSDNEEVKESRKHLIMEMKDEVKKIEKEKNIIIFSKDEYQELDTLRERRNFWSHVCYTEAYDKNTGAPRNAQMLSTDLRKAETFLERLRKIKEVHMGKNREKIMDSLFCV